VTAIVHRYNPVAAVLQIATLGVLAPGRVMLGVGSGEAMNEAPAGMSLALLPGEAGRAPLAAGAASARLPLRLPRGRRQAGGAAREWKGTMVDRHYTDDIADPAQIYRNGADEVPPVKRIKAIEKLGADVLCLMNVSGADPHVALRFYGDNVLPELRKG
jgi:hypothetical protein